MNISKSEKPKVEKMFRIFLQKLKSTRIYPNKKILYKDIWAYSYEEALKIAKDYAIENELKVLNK